MFTMKLATAALLIAPAVAFSPATSFGVRTTALNMATETATEKKVSCSKYGRASLVVTAANPVASQWRDAFLG